MCDQTRPTTPRDTEMVGGQARNVDAQCQQERHDIGPAEGIACQTHDFRCAPMLEGCKGEQRQCLHTQALARLQQSESPPEPQHTVGQNTRDAALAVWGPADPLRKV
eukprot:2066683-Lingulodinium_polyedra.AAC.2